MSTRNLSNVSIAKFTAFLKLALCNFAKIEGGHQKWTRTDLFRPISYQTHIDPVPEFIAKNNLRVMGYSKNDFFEHSGGEEGGGEGGKQVLV